MTAARLKLPEIAPSAQRRIPIWRADTEDRIVGTSVRSDFRRSAPAAMGAKAVTWLFAWLHVGLADDLGYAGDWPDVQ